MPRIGLVTESDLNRHVLQCVLAEKGYEVLVSLDSGKLAAYFEKNTIELDAWLVDLAGGEDQRALDYLVEHSELPLLVNDDVPLANDITAHQYWQRRLFEKLEVVAVHHSAAKTDSALDGQSRANEVGKDWANTVWVLAASLGGPDAVRSFLSKLDPGLPLALVYAQHIEASFDEILAESGSQQAYPMQLLRGEHVLCAGEVGVVPADRQLRFLANGRVVETRKAWEGNYQPVLDQVIAELARTYRENFGVIVFSGTCNDGEIGCRVAKACGGQVWVQTPDSCVSSAMPMAAISTGCVSHQGTPEELAATLSQLMRGEQIIPVPPGTGAGGENSTNEDSVDKDCDKSAVESIGQSRIMRGH